MRLLGTIARLAAATVLVAAAGTALLPAAPATAATCSGGTGVTVVVDFHELGGGAQSFCEPQGAGDTAYDLLSRHFSVTMVQRQPGFVCRIDGRPSRDDDPCVNTPPADAYWSVWSSDGTGGWGYATSGAGSLSVDDGGSVGFSWNGSSGRVAPGIAPPRRPKPSASAKPTKKPSAKPTSKLTHKLTHKPTAKPTTQSSATSGSAPTASPSAGTSASTSESPTASASPTESASPSDSASPSAPAPSSDDVGPSDDVVQATSDPADPSHSDGGLPTWVGPVVVAVVLAAGAGVAVVRRRRSPAP